MKFFSRASILSFLVITLLSCSSRQKSADQLTDVADLKDFPKDWVLAEDIAPSDSINRNYVVLLDSANSFLGSSVIQQNGDRWQMTNTGFYYPGTYLIKICKKTTEGEMVYFDFDLQNMEDSTMLKLKVNFRHNPGQSDDVPSVFTCTTCDNIQDILLVEKSMVDKYQKKSVGSLQYD